MIPIAKIQSKKIEYDGYEFDSTTECEYYKKLVNDPNVINIDVHPVYTLVDPHDVECKRCGGRGQQTSTKTGNWIQCSLCKGKGVRTKNEKVFTADFRVTYLDGYEEVIDVKGSKYQTKDTAFRLRCNIYASRYGKEVTVVYPKKKEWIVL